MTLDILNKDTVQISESPNLNWKEAITLAAQPLVNEGNIGKDYVDDMINTVENVGPYFNIGPGIALAHSRPIPSVKKISLALLKTNQSVDLVNKKHPVKLWFVLAATDNKSHLKVLQQLSKILMNSKKYKELMESKSVNELLKILQGE